jgi:hypothetical protein
MHAACAHARDNTSLKVLSGVGAGAEQIIASASYDKEYWVNEIAWHGKDSLLMCAGRQKADVQEKGIVQLIQVALLPLLCCVTPRISRDEMPSAPCQHRVSRLEMSWHVPPCNTNPRASLRGLVPRASASK